MPLDREELVRRLTATFLEEVAEHVRVFNRELLALERDPESRREESVQSLFRAAHSLKGAARSVNATAIALLAHKLEELLLLVRDGNRPLSADTFALLFRIADELIEGGERFRVGVVDDPVLLELAGLVEAATASTSSAPSRPAPQQGSSKEEYPASEPNTQRAGKAPHTLIPPKASDSVRAPAEAERALPLEELGMLRVSKRRLDRLVARSGELRSARLRLDARRRDLERLDELVQRWRSEWTVGKRSQGRAAPRARKVGTANADDKVGGYLKHLEQELSRLMAAFKADQREIERTAEPLENDVLRLRMEPFGETADGLSRIARDLAFSESKLVELSIHGSEIEIDRSLLEALKAPLTHLLRNAIDHGIEPPAERLRLGKPERGRISISARLRGDLVEIEISDDGRGLALDAIRERARAGGIDVPDGGDVSRLIFVHGLSTAERVTAISGRGVGLDVVKTELEAVNGRVQVTSEAGRGTRFLLELPPSLSTIRVLLVRSAGEVFALPCTSVERLVRLESNSLKLIDGKPVATLGDLPLPIASLSRVLGLAAPALGAGGKLTVAILFARGRRVGLAVDEALSHREVLLKPFGRRFRRLRHVSAATILPDGRLCLVLDSAEIVGTALELQERERLFDGPAAAEARRRLLLVDDSMTTRTLERNILESAGYEVLTATDGRAALELLERKGADVVVSDVEMPNLDGLGLVSAIRASSRFRDLPVILLTSLDAPDHRKRGLDAGADAYLVKSAFDQTRLLETIRQLL